jgi:D-arabinose 1-dehydrogenase-like Zn-dependent alcohol dehydrogenase
MGAELTIKVTGEDPIQGIMDFSGGSGVEAVIDFVGNPRMQMLALDVLSTGGRLAVVSYSTERPFQVSSYRMVGKELEIYGSRACGHGDLKKCIDLVASSQVKPLVTTFYPLAQANDALTTLNEGATVGRSVLMP